MLPLGPGIVTLLAAAGSPQPSAPSIDTAIHWRSHPASAAVAIAATPVDTLSAALAAGDSHVIVRFDRPVSAGLRNELRLAGIDLQAYLDANAYFAKVAATAPALLSRARTPAATLAEVSRIDVNWKLHPMLARGETPTWAVLPPPTTLPTTREGITWIAAYALFHADTAMLDAADLAESFEGVVVSQLDTVRGLVIELPLDQIANFAASDAVMYIEPALPPMVENNDSNRAITGTNIVQAAPYGLSGAGVSVLVYDGGFALGSHVDFQGRLSVRDTSGLSNHATHVSGTIGGGGVANPNLRGMAPGVTIESFGFEQVGGLRQGFLYTDPGDLLADYTNAVNVLGADIANNSIGTNTAPNGFPCTWEGDYGVTDTVIDSIVRGGLGAPVRVVWANGNERSSGRCGTTYHTTAPPACAKNHITVGALNSNDDSVTFFTSWGPADDGRLKPDISAPGCQVGGDGGVTSCSSLGTTAYTTFCGTSMASPTVCGMSALLLEDFRTQFPTLPDPRNSTLKILLAHNAQDIDAVGPDYKTGYGSVRIQPTIDFLRTGQFDEDQVDQGGVYRMTLNVGGAQPTLKVTIAWDDVPGTPNVGNALVNDLDLVVLDPSGIQRFPWTLGGLANPAAPAVRTVADHINNIEQVLVDAPTPGAWTIEVHGFNVPSGPQPFSICFSPAATTDCNGNGINDLQDIADGTSADCDLNSVPDECQPATDCNNNGVRDFCDIHAGTSTDVNNNRIPDECEPDCNGNNIPDAWDLQQGTSLDCNLNNVPDECDIGTVSQDCNANGIPDECETDCNNNNVPDVCDIAGGTSNDCNLNAIPDECEPDCNNNDVPDDCDRAANPQLDCNTNSIIDSCESSLDCNGNGEVDFCDLIRGTSADVNSNNVPDDCEPDCNVNGIPDAWDISTGNSPDCNANAQPDECDIAAATSEDCDSDQVPDECQSECNGNGIPDFCDIRDGNSADCDLDGVPDECQTECNGNGVPDFCDIRDGTSTDCNANGIPDECDTDCNLNGVADECDIANGTSQDANGDGYPDECDRLYVNHTATGRETGASWEDAFPYLQAALAQADENLGVREIWIAAGPYQPSSGSPFVIRNGLTLYGGFAGDESSTGERNLTANITLLGAGNLGSVQHVVAISGYSSGVALDGVRITRGFGSGANTGGGILIVGGAPTIRNCRVYENWSGSGGGAFVQNAAATFIDCEFGGNIAQTGNGGGISTAGNGSLTLTRCRFVSNYCRESGGGQGRGGGVYNAPGFTLRVTNCLFDANTAYQISSIIPAFGGNLANASSNAWVESSTFLRGTASAGGGIGTSAPITIVNCIFSGNKAIDGANASFDTGEGGAIFGEVGVNITVKSCAIAGNWAQRKAAGFSCDGTMDNCIVWHNAIAPLAAGDEPVPLIDIQFQGDAEIRYSNVAGLLHPIDGGDTDEYPGSLDTNPRFVTAPIMTAGGSFTPGDLHLQSNSPCLDAGENASLPPLVTTDMDGLPRKYDLPGAPNVGSGNPPVDMGPFESQPVARPGDVDGDGAVDLTDLSMLLAAFGTCVGDPAYVAAADIDDDGCVGLSDLAVLLANFGT
ncbi:MAG: S8 family serine peptidase [Phycisphaerae bacterium]